MKVRGERECLDCGATWSYYETGSVTCPSCGGIESRGLEDSRKLHTASPVALDLADVRADAGTRPLWELTDEAKAVCRDYVRRDGFLRAGELLALDEVHVAARELRQVADVVGRSMSLDEPAERYLLALLRGADAGERPGPEEVPASLRAPRGLAVANAVDAYRGAVRDWLDEHPKPEAEPAVQRLDQHATRLQALQGDVPPAESERLVAAARDISRTLSEDAPAALSAAADRLDRLEAFHDD